MRSSRVRVAAAGAVAAVTYAAGYGVALLGGDALMCTDDCDAYRVGPWLVGAGLALLLVGPIAAGFVRGGRLPVLRGIAATTAAIGCDVLLAGVGTGYSGAGVKQMIVGGAAVAGAVVAWPSLTRLSRGRPTAR